MKQTKLFHYLYLIFMFVPFMAVPFNLLSCIKTGTSFTFADVVGYISFPTFSNLSISVNNAFVYLVSDLFGYSGASLNFYTNCLTYWLCNSLIWLVFDVLIYVPFLMHNMIDKSVSCAARK